MLFPTIRKNCSDFLEKSNGIPLKKTMRGDMEGFARVKIRHKKASQFSEAFSKEFSHIDPLLYKRCIMAGEPWCEATSGRDEQYFIFPPNGFKVLTFSNNFVSTKILSESFEKINKVNDEFSRSFLESILRENVKYDSLYEGLTSGNELLIFGVDHYYAIKCSLIEDYQKSFY